MSSAERARVRTLRLIVEWADREIAVLDPGIFALVMATGIISNALLLQRHGALSDAMFAVNLFAYPWLLLLTVVRAARFGNALAADLLSPQRVFSFFTIVAATDMEAWRAPRADQLRAGILEPGVSLRHVLGGESTVVIGGRRSGAASMLVGHGLDSARRMGRDQRRPACFDMAQRSGFIDADLSGA
jgi:hypothetical protein